MNPEILNERLDYCRRRHVEAKTSVEKCRWWRLLKYYISFLPETGQ